MLGLSLLIFSATKLDVNRTSGKTVEDGRMGHSVTVEGYSLVYTLPKYSFNAAATLLLSLTVSPPSLRGPTGALNLVLLFIYEWLTAFVAGFCNPSFKSSLSFSNFTFALTDFRSLQS